MKNRFLLYLLLICCSANAIAQELINGQIIDADSKEALPYVNIGIIGKNVGTVSSEQGFFKLAVNAVYDNDTLRISMIGYKDQEYVVSDFKKKIFQDSIVQLAQEITQLPQVIISSKDLKEKILGNKTTNQYISGGFSTNELGNEVGIKIKIKKSPTYIEKFSVHINQNEYDSLKFRLNFYDLKNGMPNKRILYENIFIESQIKEGILSIDLSDRNIVVKDDFFVSLEWIQDLGEGGLFFSCNFFKSPIIARQTSQGDWQKIGIISLGFHVHTKY